MNKYEEAVEYLKNHYLAYIEHIQDNREEIDRHNKAMDLAIEALEKQIPKGTFLFDTRTWICPDCGAMVFPHQSNSWCDWCGQAIDWSEE